MMIPAVHFGIHALFYLGKRNKESTISFEKMSSLPIQVSENATRIVKKEGMC